MDKRINKEVAKAVRDYEMAMLNWVFGRITDGAGPASSDPKNNMLLEDFLLHARVLRGFFCDSPRRDDISAGHFFDNDNEWLTLADSLCPYLKTHKERLDKKLAHLTYGGMVLDQKWDIRAIYEEVRHAWEQFLAKLTDERRKWFT